MVEHGAEDSGEVVQFCLGTKCGDVNLIGKISNCKFAGLRPLGVQVSPSPTTGDFSSMVERFFVAEDISVQFWDFTHIKLIQFTSI